MTQQQQHQISSIDLNRIISTVADAYAKVAPVEGVWIQPSDKQEWAYHIFTPDEQCDRMDVSIDELPTAVLTVVNRFQAEDDERDKELANVMPDLRITVPPTSK